MTLARGTERTRLLTLVEAGTNRNLGGGEEKVHVSVCHTYGQGLLSCTFDFSDIADVEPQWAGLRWYAQLSALPLIRRTEEVVHGACSFPMPEAALERGAGLALYALPVDRTPVFGINALAVTPARKEWTSSKRLAFWPLAQNRGILPLQRQSLDGLLWRVRLSAGEDFKPIIAWNEKIPMSQARRPEVMNSMLPGILYQIAYELLRRSQEGMESSGDVEEQWREMIPGTSMPASGGLEDTDVAGNLADMAAIAVADWGTKHPEHLRRLRESLELIGVDE